MKKCKTCEIEKPDDEFPLRSDSKTYRTSCRQCESEKRVKRGYFKSEMAVINRRKRSNEFQKKQRANPTNAAKYIVKDSKNADKKYNRENDLNREFVRNLIEDGCSYCGETTLRMTMDRIDNNIGHITTNVIAACYRCNMLRGNMPYKAWLNIVPVIRETREKGLFEDWCGHGPWAKVGGKKGI